VLHYAKDGAETSMLALHLLQSSLVHANTLLLQQVPSEPVWALLAVIIKTAVYPRSEPGVVVSPGVASGFV
jgi:hypothetical protein